MITFWAVVIGIVIVASCAILSLIIWIISFCDAADINPFRFLEKIADNAEETAKRFNERRTHDETDS